MHVDKGAQRAEDDNDPFWSISRFLLLRTVKYNIHNPSCLRDNEITGRHGQLKRIKLDVYRSFNRKKIDHVNWQQFRLPPDLHWQAASLYCIEALRESLSRTLGFELNKFVRLRASEASILDILSTIASTGHAS